MGLWNWTAITAAFQTPLDYQQQIQFDRDSPLSSLYHPCFETESLRLEGDRQDQPFPR